MNIIKRDGSEVVFNGEKIINAISKARADVPENDWLGKLDDECICNIAGSIEQLIMDMGYAVSVEFIQDLVETKIMESGAFEVAKSYIRYRHTKTLQRNENGIDKRVLSIVDCTNEEVMQENSNKNPIIASTQRDYMAGELSKELTNKYFLPRDIKDAHDAGIIHFHDQDYFSQRIFNCCLVNLEDMLMNGTVIQETQIESPHSFSTACNIATQIMAQVASCQYGGQTETLSHLAPFVDVSRQKIRKSVIADLEYSADEVEEHEDQITRITERRLRDEIKRGVQTIQYQILTLMSTNGLNGETGRCKIA